MHSRAPAPCDSDAYDGRRRRPGLVFLAVKRAMDIVGATLGLIATAPVIAGCAVWVRLADGGPAFYSQWRVGRGGWLFRIYKLRTMRADAERPGEAQFARTGDARILRGCGWMRKSHADELPQLWNILRGQMSLVGPRPERPEVLETLRPRLPRIDQRLAGKPGLTGLAQILNGYTADLPGVRRKLAYDLLYLRRRSLTHEVRLLVGTLPKVWDRWAA